MILKPSVRIPVFAFIGGLTAFLTAYFFYPFLWDGFGYMLAGEHSLQVKLPCYLLPTVCGALACGLDAEYVPQLYGQMVKGMLMAVGVTGFTFLWQFAMVVLPPVLEGKLIARYVNADSVLDLLNKICPLLIWAGPVWFAIVRIFKRTDRIV